MQGVSQRSCKTSATTETVHTGRRETHGGGEKKRVGRGHRGAGRGYEYPGGSTGDCSMKLFDTVPRFDLLI